jgi:hypothetical protein
MAEGRRPGGLTALAVLNFVFSGFNALFLLGLVIILGVKYNGTTDANLARDAGRISFEIAWTLTLLTGLRMALLIASGVGYLKQRRFLGRMLGNGYAIVSLVDLIISVATREDLQIGQLIVNIYPVLTLILLNTTFKDDLVN